MESLIHHSIGEYRVTELIGRGGMGEVYKARHAHLGREIAIKVLSPELAGTPALERFYGEAGILAKLRHPGIAEYLGFFEYAGRRPCILMEYVDGESLSSLIARRGPLPVEDAMRWLGQMAEAIAHCHALGIVHRDLKSGNIKIDSAGRARILDFGIARERFGMQHTQVGTVIGTPSALAPEQVRGEAVTPAVDVWQLGVLLYEMLTGVLPFQAEAPHEIFALILQAEPAPLGRLRPGLPIALERLAVRCLQKHPAHRFPSAAELHQALGELRQAQPRGLPALPVRRLAIGVGAGVLTLALGIGGIALLRGRPEGPPPAEEPPAATAVVVPTRLERTVTIDTADGAAEVLQGGKPAGTTPFRVTAPPGAKVDLVLRRPGFRDLAVEFEVTERREYTYTLQKEN